MVYLLHGTRHLPPPRTPAPSVITSVDTRRTWLGFRVLVLVLLFMVTAGVIRPMSGLGVTVRLLRTKLVFGFRFRIWVNEYCSGLWLRLRLLELGGDYRV